jgi:hypothetical protein
MSVRTRHAAATACFAENPTLKTAAFHRERQMALTAPTTARKADYRRRLIFLNSIQCVLKQARKQRK